MRILHIIRTVNPEGGGPIEGIKQLALPMIQNGNQIEVLSLDSPMSEYINSFDIKIHAMGPGHGKYGYSAKFKPWLAANYQKYDIFVINGIWQYHSFATHSVLKKLNKPYYVFTHGMLDPWFKNRYPLKHLKKCLYWLWGEYPVLRDAKKVLFTCEDERSLALHSFWPSKWNEQVINYGTAGQHGDEKFQRQLFLNNFPLLQDKRILLFLSRIHPKKGVDLLISAFAKTCQLDSNLHLVIAGPDQVGWQSKLTYLINKLGIEDKVTWTGMLKDDLKWGAFLCADAFVLPSHQENFGIVVAEALSCGKPVLISNKVNIWHEIQTDGAGFIDEDTLAGTLGNFQRFLAMNFLEYAQMSERASNCFKSRFHIEHAAMRLLNLFQDITR